MLAKRLIKSNDAGGGACTNTVDLYNPFPDGGGVALYQLNGDATDVSGNYDGTASNVTYNTGVFGQAGVFNGSSSYVGMATNSWNSFTSYTASFWIYDTGTATGGRTMVSNYGYTAASNVEKGWIIMRVGTKLRISNATTGLASTYLSTNDIPFNQWAHIVVTNTQSEIKIYFNGVLDSTHTTNGFLNDASWPMRPAIGVYRYETTETRNGYFNGSIDQVRIFNRALRPYEVEALYTEEYCTPTIVPSEHFNTVTYTGNRVDASTTNPQTVGFQPDLTWVKIRTQAYSHLLMDSVRGGDFALYSDLSNAETGINNNFGGIDFVPNGIVVNSSANAVDGLNKAGDEFVAWNFKAGGAAVTNTDGTITSQVSANTEAGFSIVSYTGSGANATVGHGLGVNPSMIIVKGRNTAYDWVVYNSNLGATQYIVLNKTDQAFSASSVWNDTEPTNSVFSVGSNLATNQSADPKIAYCFAEVEGFSNFGSYVGKYTGTGAVPDNTIITGFEPAFVMIKAASRTEWWTMYDNKRNISNPRNSVLFANEALAELTNTNYDVEFLENGFNVKSIQNFANQIGETYIYMAFAADPTAVEPTLEDSFNTVLYTANGGVLPVTGVGFQPDLVWIKQRTSTGNHSIFDSIRGVEKYLLSNSTVQETDFSGVNGLTSFNLDGFTVDDTGGLDYNVNHSGNYVAWNWKGAEIPAINSNGSIPSVVSANPAAGFSIVSYTGTETISTIGHGLSLEPKMIIVKRRENTNDNWYVYNSNLSGISNYLQLNTTAAELTFSPSIWGGSAPTSTVFSVGTDPSTNSLNEKMIAYCFAEVAGFSKFGSYTGTGSAGNAVTLGFEPAFLLIKRTDIAGNGWLIADNKRDTTNPIELFLSPNTSQAEFLVTNGIDFNANDFTLDSTNGSLNASGGTYIYMAFANQL